MVHYCQNEKCGLPFHALTQKEKFCHKCRRTGVAYYTPAPTLDRKCPTCGKSFATNHSKKIYCSQTCREAADIRGNKEMIKVCKQCGIKFETTDTRKKYCSKSCYIEAKALRSKRNGNDHD